MSVPVYVLNMRGQPLMPTTPQKARKLVKDTKAKVIQRVPSTIQIYRQLWGKAFWFYCHSAGTTSIGYGLYNLTGFLPSMVVIDSQGFIQQSRIGLISEAQLEEWIILYFMFPEMVIKSELIL